MTYDDYNTASLALCTEELARFRQQAVWHRAQAARADEEVRRWQAALDARQAEAEVAP